MCKVHQNNPRGLRIYTKERIAKMSPQDKQNAIDAVKTSPTLTSEEKEANLALLEKPSAHTIALQQLSESAAEIGDIHE